MVKLEIKGILMPLFICLACLSACTNTTEETFTTTGLKPVYIDQAQAHHIYTSPPQNIVKLGKIYTKPPFIYLNDSGLGVHVVDNSNPADPQRIAFIHIPGNQDIAIKGNYLYADNAGDLVTLNIADLQNITEVSRIANLYPFEHNAYPLNYNGYFECADSTKGLVVAWQQTTLENPKCQR